MTPPKPVPSRAAIHALRGLVFTTSCSVAILAEERRRRLKTVRAAAENARKIHAAKAHRGAAAVDGLAAWEAKVLHRQDEVSTLEYASPSPRDFRRPADSGDSQHSTVKRNYTRRRAMTSTGLADDSIPILAAYTESRKSAPYERPTGEVQPASQLSKSQRSLLQTRRPVSGDIARPLRSEDLHKNAAQFGATRHARQGSLETSANEAWPKHEAEQSLRRTRTSSRTAQDRQTRARALTPSAAPDGDALAAWARISDEATRLREKETDGTSRAREERTVCSKRVLPLVDAGDGLATWEATFRRRHNNKASNRRKKVVTTSQTWSPMSSQDPEQACTASTGDLRGQTDRHITQRTNMALPQHKVKGQTLSRLRMKKFLQESELFRSGFDPAKALNIVQKFTDEQRLHATAGDLLPFWADMCTVTQRIKDWYRTEDEPSLYSALGLMLGFMRHWKADVPEATLAEQKASGLLYLQQVATSQSSKLQDNVMLFVPDGNDWLGLLPDLFAWTVKHHHKEILRQLVGILREAGPLSLARETIALIPSRDVTLEELYDTFTKSVLDQDESPEAMLGYFARIVVTVDGVVNNDALTLDLLRKLDDHGIADEHGGLAHASIMRDVPQQTPEMLLTRIKQLIQDPADYAWLRKWRQRITSTFVASHKLAENETFLRGFHDIEPDKVASEWVEPILCQHSELGDLDGFLDCLQLCVVSGSHLQPGLLQQTVALLAKQWTIPPNLLQRLQREIGQLLASHSRTSSAGQDSPARDVDSHAAIKGVGYDELLLKIRQSDPSGAIETYQKLLDQGKSPSAASLGLAVSACLQKEGAGIMQAKTFVVEAHKRSIDVSEEMRRLLARELRHDSDPGARLAAAREHGIVITTELYNIVVRRLLQAQETEQAIQLCQRWADEQGQGVAGFDMYNFACFVRAYVQDGSKQGFDALRELMSRFVAEPRWWHRSAVCKETIKLCQKRLLDQARNPRASSWASSVRRVMLSHHEEALQALDRGLEHVTQRRAVSGDPGWIVHQVGNILNIPVFSASSDPERTSPREELPARPTEINKTDRTTGLARGQHVRSSSVIVGRKAQPTRARAHWQRNRHHGDTKRGVLPPPGGHGTPKARRRLKQGRQSSAAFEVGADNVWEDLLSGRIEA